HAISFIPRSGSASFAFESIRSSRRNMKLFLDSADTKEIASLAATGLVDGVTTNPSLAAKTGQPLFEALRAICDLVPGSVSAEVTALETESMIDRKSTRLNSSH